MPTLMDGIEIYHVSPKENLASILKLGVLPNMSRGAEKVSWYVTRDKLAWACAHVSARHSIAVDALVVFPVRAHPDMLIKTAWEGVYKTRHALDVEYGTSATRYID